jgi:AcrR family transcriptional regulator
MSGSGPRDQILATATRLFFTQGYTQTGINQLVDESVVARRTFYHHFPSKEALGEAYLQLASARFLEALRCATHGRRSAAGVVRALFESLEHFAVESDYRGCGLANMAAEFADGSSLLRERVRGYKLAQRRLVHELLSPFGVPLALTEQIFVLIEGALAAAAALLDVAPIRSAAAAAITLLRSRQHQEMT